MLLIIDNQNVFIDLFQRDFLDMNGIEYVVIKHNQPIDLSLKKKIKGVILSGGRGNPFKPLNLTANFQVLMNFDVPIMGFCLAHEIIAIAFGGTFEKLDTYHTKKEIISIIQPGDPIFIGLQQQNIKLQKRHSYHVNKIPGNFIGYC